MYSGEPACTAHVGDGRPRPSGLSEARRCCKKEFSINNWENSRLHGFGKRMTSNRAAAQPLRLRSAHSRLWSPYPNSPLSTAFWVILRSRSLNSLGEVKNGCKDV